MTKRDKRIKRFRENDKNVRFEEIDGLLIYLGFTRTTRGSHNTYRSEKIPFDLTIPYRKPFLLPIYVKQILAILDEYFEEELDS